MTQDPKALEQKTLEMTGPSFSTEKMLYAREKTLEALDRISKVITPGMTEDAATQEANSILKDMGASKFWHRSLVRFGPNTLKVFNEVSAPGVRLGEDDIFFLDLGPVWDGHEGDAGATYVTGRNPEMFRCKEDSKKIFSLVQDHWTQTQASGAALYEFAAQTAEKMGWQLNLKINGHRVSDFPHALYTKTGLGKISFTPSPILWILEIQICHKTLPFGAFYEDLLAH